MERAMRILKQTQELQRRPFEARMLLDGVPQGQKLALSLQHISRLCIPCAFLGISICENASSEAHPTMVREDISRCHQGPAAFLSDRERRAARVGRS